MVFIKPPILYTAAIVKKIDLIIHPIVIKYEGPQASTIVKNHKKLIASALEIKEEDLREVEITVSRKEKEELKEKLSAIIKLDKFSYYLFECDFSSKIDADGSGTVEISFKLTLFVEFPLEETYQQSIIYRFFRDKIFYELYYKKIVEKYAAEGKERIVRIEKRLRELLKI